MAVPRKSPRRQPHPDLFQRALHGAADQDRDGQDNPLPSTKNAKFFEVTKSITLTNHLVDSVWPTINEARWQSLSEQQKAW